MPTEIRVLQTPADLAHQAAEFFVKIFLDAAAKRGRFTVALSGGSTPRAMYELLSTSDIRSSGDWSKAFFFFGDERNVPVDSPESNFRMANESLLANLPISVENVHRWPVERGDSTEIASSYDLAIREFFQGPPRFDLFLLGLGPDCHTASLFPRTPALKERDAFAVASWVPKLNDNRFTMTASVINAAANIAFLVAGSEKAQAVKAAIDGDGDPDDCPAQLIRPTDGDLVWFLDTAAASQLEHR